MSVISISAAVGLNAPNRYEDVAKVQVMLNHFIGNKKLLGYAPLGLDGKCGPKTREAIMAFQFQNGLVSDEHFNCQVRPQGKTIAFMNKNAGHIPAASSSKPVIDWVLDDVEAWEIQKKWGQEILDWIRVPPEGREAKEFNAPASMRSDYKTVVVWKSLDAKKDCPLMRQPYKRVQIIALLRDDKPYWDARTNGSAIQSNMLRTAAETAILDYREYVIRRKYCPPAAYSRLLQVNKDVVYEMFLGMFQLLSPHPASSVPGGPYYKSAVKSVPGAIKKLIQQLDK